MASLVLWINGKRTLTHDQRHEVIANAQRNRFCRTGRLRVVKRRTVRRHTDAHRRHRGQGMVSRQRWRRRVDGALKALQRRRRTLCRRCAMIGVGVVVGNIVGIVGSGGVGGWRMMMVVIVVGGHCFWLLLYSNVCI